MPQPNLVPVRPATSRTAHSKGMLGSASSVVDLPLRENDVDMDTPFRPDCRRSILQIQCAIGWFILAAIFPEALVSSPPASRCQTNTAKRVGAREYASGRAGSVVDEGLSGKQRIVEAELGQIANAARIQDPVEMVHFVLYHPGMKVLDRAVDGPTGGVEAGIAQISIPRYEPA